MVGLSLNYEKFKVIPLFRTRYTINFDYLINNECLPQVNHIKNLKCKLVPLSYFRNHVEFITRKALRILGYILRNGPDFDRANRTFILYTTLVRSLLEQGSVLCNLHSQKETRRIERIQKCFILFAGKFSPSTQLYIDINIFKIISS